MPLDKSQSCYSATFTYSTAALHTADLLGPLHIEAIIELEEDGVLGRAASPGEGVAANGERGRF